MNRPGSFRLAIALALALSAATLHAQALRTEYVGPTALGLELRRLGTTKRVLMIGAHPDDERTEVLTALALGSGAEVAYLSLSRGEGGQNAIGPELQEGLGLIRTEELLAARRVDGARQYFGRAYDFGFSKNADEAFRHWPHDPLLGDVVATIRAFRPDVVIAVFTGTPADGHGQHQVSGILAKEGFAAAGDPTRFPEQLAAGLKPWSAAKLYQGAWSATTTGPASQINTGQVDALLGRSYAQVAATSRSRHRSQGFGGASAAAGARVVTMSLAQGTPAPPEAGVFAGIDTTFSVRVAAARGKPGVVDAAIPRAVSLLTDYEQRVSRLAHPSSAPDPAALVPDLTAAVRTLTEAQAAVAATKAPEIADRLAAERAEAEDALWRAQGLTLDAVAEDETLVPGQQFNLDLSLRNNGSAPVTVQSLEPRLPSGWATVASGPAPARIAPGATATRRFRVTVPANAPLTQPYFLRTPRRGDMYVWPAGVQVGLPFDPAAVQAAARVAIDGATASYDVEGTFARPDSSAAGVRRPVRVVAPVSLVLDPTIIAVPLGTGAAGAPLKVSVQVRAEAPRELTGTLRLRVPAGWRVAPESVPLRLAPGESRAVELTVTPPASLATGETQLSAVLDGPGGASYTSGYTLIDYPHIRPEALPRVATVRVRAFDVQVPRGLRVGFIPGSGDDAPQALRQLGVDITELGPTDLASGDFSRFDAILVGIRAYEVRPDTVNGDLVRNNARVLDYVKNGGTLVVQYQRFENTTPNSTIAPYPLTARLVERITDEAAAVRLLAPEHQALSWPNRITAADFAGWVQERGLYYPRQWDPHFTPLLEMADPGEAPQQSALLVAPYEKGTYVYTGLSLFRQYPEGVPGAYRILANLVSLGKKP
jgi:LmbE family N-acetylglucosaminyl deacetylase